MMYKKKAQGNNTNRDENGQIIGTFKRTFKGSTRQGKFLRSVAEKLRIAVGPRADIPQVAAYIPRIAFTLLRLNLLEKEFLLSEFKDIPEWREKIYLQWKASLRSDLQLIGLNAETTEGMSWQELMAKYAKQSEAPKQ